jgi:hypothetical protein
VFDLTKELDAAGLAFLLGYSEQVMTVHAARTGNTMASHPASKTGSLKNSPLLELGPGPSGLRVGS